MSHTSLYGFREDGISEKIAEYSNAWLSAPLIWNYLFAKYVKPKLSPHEMYAYALGSMDRICALQNDASLHQWERDCLMMTFDGALVKREHCERMAASLREFSKHLIEFPHNHLLTIAADILSRVEFSIFGFHWTSVAESPWLVYEEDDSRPYNLAVDKKHWFLFDPEEGK